MGLAYLSILLFIIRFAMFRMSPALKANKLFKILPHVIDTLLLVFAILLCIEIPLTDHWLTAKVAGLIAYIGFGTVAIKRGNTMAFILALVSFAYVFGAAKAHSVMSWLALL
jgi:uncharacterized membrane protein SirB2